jgi:hypothetical protein
MDGNEEKVFCTQFDSETRKRAPRVKRGALKGQDQSIPAFIFDHPRSFYPVIAHGLRQGQDGLILRCIVAVFSHLGLLLFRALDDFYRLLGGLFGLDLAILHLGAKSGVYLDLFAGHGSKSGGRRGIPAIAVKRFHDFLLEIENQD